jgi:hypothetical protein
MRIVIQLCGLAVVRIMNYLICFMFRIKITKRSVLCSASLRSDKESR